MAHYFLVVSPISLYPGSIDAVAVAQHRFREGKWPFFDHTGFKNTICEGDRFLLYISGQAKVAQCFYAMMSAASCVIDMRIRDPENWCNPQWNKGILLKDISILTKPVFVHEIMKELSFITNPELKKWGVYFRGGCKKIPESDYNMIVSLSKMANAL